MAVRIRMFASLREAAGTPEDKLDAGRLGDLLDELRARYGEPFTTRLAVSTVLLDGDAVPRDAAIEVADGAEIVLLPPVSGGAAG